ncbi:MAG: hypothetical protein NT040_11070 [Bacteroidetes bacterium]|nr:hypothetical protein [Bacteroidota bacterium]
MDKDKIRRSASGFLYYSELPPGFRVATIEDFISNGYRKIDMKFLIQWVDDASFYQICFVSKNLTRAILNPHLKDKRVFVCDES